MANREPTGFGNRSKQDPLLAFGDINAPIVVTGPTLEVDLGFLPPHDGVQIKFDAVACLGQAPRALAAYVTTSPGSRPGSVLISVWTSAFAAAAGSTVTNVHLLATRGSSVGK